MDFGLSDRTLNKLKSVFQSFPEIEKALIFGSRAEGTFREGSDIDIALKGNLNFKLMLTISRKLDELNLPYKIDLVDIDRITEPALLQHIDNIAVEIYSL
jgi:predicted nucleotidyltransferase